MKRYHIHTFGCQMNVHDSEKIAGLLQAQGMSEEESGKEADLIVFNTCSIREKAEQKFFSELGRLKALKKIRPHLKVAVSGCIAQQMGEELLKRAPHVDYIIGPQNIHALGDLIREPSGIATQENPEIACHELPAVRKERGRAWVNIMYGCNNFCTYCIVPFTRGRERSRPQESVIREVHGLVGQGVSEVTLLGQNVNSYSGDGGFPGLLHKIDEIPGLRRIRFVTSHPRDLTSALIDAMAECESVCEHIHLPLQSGATRVLGLMNRGYSYEEYFEKVMRLRERIPGVAITSDIIAGFPGETDEDHQATLDALREVGFDGVFAFKYSPRPGTRASKMDSHLPEEQKLARLLEILSLQDEITLSINHALVGENLDVLVEGPSDTDPLKLTGRTRTNKIVTFISDRAGEGDVLTVRIVEHRKHSLHGEVVSA